MKSGPCRIWGIEQNRPKYQLTWAYFESNNLTPKCPSDQMMMLFALLGWIRYMISFHECNIMVKCALIVPIYWYPKIQYWSWCVLPSNFCFVILSQFRGDFGICTTFGCNKKERWLDVTSGVNYGDASFWVGLNLYVIPWRALRELQAPKNISYFQRWTPWMGCDRTWRASISSKDKSQGFPYHWLKISGSFAYPPPPHQCDSWLGWSIGDSWVHQKPSARKVTHFSTILTLSHFTLEFTRDPWDHLV